MSVFDFSLITTTPQEVLSLYSEEAIYQHYWPAFRFGNCHSPLRTDANPSFRIYETKNDKLPYRIWWADQATGQSGHVFDFVMAAYKLHKQDYTLPEVCDRICEDLYTSNVPTIEHDVRHHKAKQRQSKKEHGVILQVVLDESNDMPDWAYAYWNRYGISRNVLDAYNVGFAKEAFIIRHEDGQRISHMWGASTHTNPIFYYYFPATKHMKFYRPLEKDRKRKWLSNVNNTYDIQGWEQAMGSSNTELLILTKSMKDVMWFRTIGLDAIAIHGERHIYNKEQMEQLRGKYRNIISLYDNDWPGMRGALRMREVYGVPCYFYPRSTGIKDTTDLYLKDYRQLFRFIDQFKQEHYGHLPGTNNEKAATAFQPHAA
jgi:hypothetical protein